MVLNGDIKDIEKGIAELKAAGALAALSDEITVTVTKGVNGLKVEGKDKNYTITFEVPYQTIEQEDPTLLKGTSKILTNGKNGMVKNDVEILYHNGVEFKKNVTQTVLEEKVDMIIAKGTKELPLNDTASNKANLNLGEPVKFSATAYCACARCCGKATGITASGRKAEYGVVAVDTRVIPLGTKLYIENVDGSFTYGEAIAADTGSAIKGNKVDLFFPTHQEALEFGLVDKVIDKR